jgi:hypothetical protein
MSEKKSMEVNGQRAQDGVQNDDFETRADFEEFDDGSDELVQADQESMEHENEDLRKAIEGQNEGEGVVVPPNQLAGDSEKSAMDVETETAPQAQSDKRSDTGPKDKVTSKETGPKPAQVQRSRGQSGSRGGKAPHVSAPNSAGTGGRGGRGSGKGSGKDSQAYGAKGSGRIGAVSFDDPTPSYRSRNSTAVNQLSMLQDLQDVLVYKMEGAVSVEEANACRSGFMQEGFGLEFVTRQDPLNGFGGGGKVLPRGSNLEAAFPTWGGAGAYITLRDTKDTHEGIDWMVGKRHASPHGDKDTNTVFTVNLEVREGLKKPFTFTLQAGLKGLQGSDTGQALWGIGNAFRSIPYKHRTAYITESLSRELVRQFKDEEGVGAIQVRNKKAGKWLNQAGDMVDLWAPTLIVGSQAALRVLTDEFDWQVWGERLNKESRLPEGTAVNPDLGLIPHKEFEARKRREEQDRPKASDEESSRTVRIFGLRSGMTGRAVQRCLKEAIRERMEERSMWGEGDLDEAIISVTLDNARDNFSTPYADVEFMHAAMAQEIVGYYGKPEEGGRITELYEALGSRISMGIKLSRNMLEAINAKRRVAKERREALTRARMSAGTGAREGAWSKPLPRDSGYGGGVAARPSTLALTKEETEKVALAVAAKIAAGIKAQQDAFIGQVDAMLKGAVRKVANSVQEIAADQAVIKSNLLDISCWLMQIMQHNGLMGEDYGMHEEEEEEMERQARGWGEGHVDVDMEEEEVVQRRLGVASALRPKPKSRRSDGPDEGARLRGKKQTVTAEEAARRQAELKEVANQALALAQPEVQEGMLRNRHMFEQLQGILAQNGISAPLLGNGSGAAGQGWQ